MRRMLAAALAALLLAQPMLAADAETSVLAAVNTARARVGCPALVMNNRLEAAAKSHARAMAEKNFFSHTGKNGSKFGSRIKAQGYHFRAAAENIAAGQSSVSEVVRLWMGSAGHRRNILNCSLRETGIALAYQPDDAPLKGFKHGFKYYWVQVFATP